MAFTTVFQRREYKYLLTKAQQKMILAAMEPHMTPDEFGRTTIRNLYFDTDDYRLIRRSIEGPVYKEKMRIRSYARAGQRDVVFVELKKKYHGVVYKRRLSLPQETALQWVQGGAIPKDTQIAREIDYFLRFYDSLKPKVFLAYDRQAYFCKDDRNFRVTFDENIRFRRDALTLDSDATGTPILDSNLVLMEIKSANSIPLWMIRVLSDAHIYKTSFSKYGTVYSAFIRPDKKEKLYA